MNLMRHVYEQVVQRGTATADDILPTCPDHTKEQVMQAMQNARHKGWLVVLDRRFKPGFGKGRLPWLYGPGKPPTKKKQLVTRAPSSVWDYARRAATISN